MNSHCENRASYNNLNFGANPANIVNLKAGDHVFRVSRLLCYHVLERIMFKAPSTALPEEGKLIRMRKKCANALIGTCYPILSFAIA